MALFRQAWRSLMRRRGFTAATILILALGIGVTTATFAIVDAVLLKPLPYPAGDRLVTVMEASPSAKQRVSLVAPARLVDWNRMSRAFEVISGAYTENVTDTGGSDPERLNGRRVAARYFEVFHARPVLGRTFLPDEERYGGAGAAVISEGLWSRRYGRSPSAVGSQLSISGRSYPIVGIMPANFAAPAIDVWLPAQFSPQMLDLRVARFLSGVGRLRPGITIAQGRADLAAVERTLGARYPKTDAGWSVEVGSLKEARVGAERQPMRLVFAAVGLLFLIAAANIAGLMLVQLHRRSGELAVRAAIGASRLQIAGAVLREVVLLAGAGTAAGVLVAAGLVRVAQTALATVPRIAEAGLDGRVLLWASFAGVIGALVFGVGPAWLATHRDRLTLTSSGRIAGGSRRAESVLLVAQIAIGLVLAGSAALLVRSYAALSGADTGLVSSNVLTFHVGAAWDEDRPRVGQLQERILEDLQQQPGVQAAGFANFLPSSGATLRSQVRITGVAAPDRADTMTAGERTVTAGYLQSLRVPLVAGSWCRTHVIDSTAPTEAMVNRKFADVYAGGVTLQGRRMAVDQGGFDYTIAGIVGDVTEDAPGAQAVPYIYLCLPYGAWPDPEYVVRTDGDMRALAPAVRHIVNRLDPSRPVFGVQTLDQALAADLDQPRLNAQALSGFAGLALALVSIGLYALLMLIVGDRRREFGVRLALGATPSVLGRAVCANALRLFAVGAACGLGLLLAAGRVLQSLLFGVTGHDPLSIAGSVALLGLVAAAAAAAPVYRATTTDPITALRE